MWKRGRASERERENRMILRLNGERERERTWISFIAGIIIFIIMTTYISQHPHTHIQRERKQTHEFWPAASPPLSLFLTLSHSLFVCAFFSGQECKCALPARVCLPVCLCVCVCGFSCRVNNFNPFVLFPLPAQSPLGELAIYKNKLNWNANFMLIERGFYASEDFYGLPLAFSLFFASLVSRIYRSHISTKSQCHQCVILCNFR